MHIFHLEKKTAGKSLTCKDLMSIRETDCQPLSFLNLTHLKDFLKIFKFYFFVFLMF